MTAKTIKIGVSIAAVALLSAVNVKAGGAYNIQWENAAEVVAANGAPFYAQDGTTKLAIGDLVQLIAFQGGTNYTLATAAIGDNALTLAFDLSQNWINSIAGHVSQVSAVVSNDLQATLGMPLGIKFYTGTTKQNSQFFGTVENLAVVVPSPNWVTPPADSILFEPDWSNAAYLGVRTVDFLGNGNDNGFIAGTTNPDFVVPEPSTLVLVGMGLFGAMGLIRRRRNG